MLHATAFDRVYIGNTDNRMYSFVARTGKLAWARSTGNYVYASPSVADVSGLGPTVYVGSYDGTFNAYDARRRHPLDLRGRQLHLRRLDDDRQHRLLRHAQNAPTGLVIRSGKEVVQLTGQSRPSSRQKRLYLDGYRNLYALDPRGVLASAAGAGDAHGGL